MQRSAHCRIVAIASRDLTRAQAAARGARHPAGLRLLRGAATRSRDRGGLQSAAQPPARAALDRGGGGRQARAVREADRAHRRGGRAADRGARPRRRADPGGVHGAQPSAVAAGARPGARGPDRRAARGPGQLQLHERRPGERAQPGRDRRRRPVRHRLLSDPSPRAFCSRRSRPGWRARSSTTRTSGPTGWRASCCSSRPARRCSAARPSSCPTSACRSSAPRAGSRSRSRSTRRPTGRAGSSSTTARGLGDASARIETFDVVDQYTVQGDLFARAIREGTPLRVSARGRGRQHARARRRVPRRQERPLGGGVRPLPRRDAGGPAQAFSPLVLWRMDAIHRRRDSRVRLG